jgi:hypothetical protein
MAMTLPVEASPGLMPMSPTAIFTPMPVPAAGSAAAPMYQR